MIKFNETGFTIELETNGFGAEHWVETVNEIITLLQTKNEGAPPENYFVLELLRHMMPTEEQTKKLAS